MGKNLLKVLAIVMVVVSVVCGREISTATDLRLFAIEVNAGNDFAGQTITLANDIDVGGEANPWVPIGSINTQFRGTFDGNGFVVSGIFINKPEQSVQGFFGHNSGTIRNLIVAGNVAGYMIIGGLVGLNSNMGKIENSGVGSFRCFPIHGEFKVFELTGKDNVAAIKFLSLAGPCS